MGTITLTQLSNKELLNTLVELAKKHFLSGSIEEHIFRVTLVKQMGVTKPAALKVLKLAKAEL